MVIVRKDTVGYLVIVSDKDSEFIIGSFLRNTLNDCWWYESENIVCLYQEELEYIAEKLGELNRDGELNAAL